MVLGSYQDWSTIDYHPAIADLPPIVLLKQVPSGSSALDVGCNTGRASLLLAEHGLKVLGVDINQAAINAARLRAAGANLSGSVDFRVADVLVDPLPGPFDVVMLVRVLTCFPDLSDWEALLKRAWALIKPYGYFYVHDFMLAPDSKNYQTRYMVGLRLGWRHGNFPVNSLNGDLQFVAHHHSDEDIAEILKPYERVHFSIHDSLSMNGNACRMFEFLGRRPE